MRHVISSDTFSYIGIPIIFLLLGILAKWIGRRDGDTAPGRNELAVGTNVLLMTTGKIVADLCTPGARPATLGIWTFVALASVFASSATDRHMSWELEPTGDVSNRKRWLAGIIIPDLVALSTFGAYQFMKIHFR